MEWRIGANWPWNDYRRPTFPRAGGIQLVYAVDEEDLLDVYHYPDDEPIPDLYGRTDKNKWLFCECKTRGIRDSLRKLEAAVEWARRERQPVDLLGILVEKLRGKDSWRQSLKGYLLKGRTLGGSPEVEVKGLKVLVEQEREV